MPCVRVRPLHFSSDFLVKGFFVKKTGCYNWFRSTCFVIKLICMHIYIRIYEYIHISTQVAHIHILFCTYIYIFTFQHHFEAYRYMFITINRLIYFGNFAYQRQVLRAECAWVVIVTTEIGPLVCTIHSICVLLTLSLLVDKPGISILK